MQTSLHNYSEPHAYGDDVFDAYVERINARIAKLGAQENVFVVAMDRGELFGRYLANLPAASRQHHNCRACEAFFDRYGHLVTVNADGEQKPLMWDAADDVPPYYAQAVQAVEALVAVRPIVNIFVPEARVLGTPVTNTKGVRWTHFAVEMPKQWFLTQQRRRGIQTPTAYEAEVRERVRRVREACAKYPAKIVERTAQAFAAESLPASEKFKAPAAFLRDIQAFWQGPRNGVHKTSGLWRAVAFSPEGYTHYGATVLGVALDAFNEGATLEQVRAKLAPMVDGINYQRPKAAPTEGQVDAAEKLIEKLGLAESLLRRPLLLEEVPKTLWYPPTPDGPAKGGVFAHLRPSEQRAQGSSPTRATESLTWAKFARTRLPQAERLEVLVPRHGDFVALTTAVNADAAPILKWDSPGERNAAAWYVYHGGSPAVAWRLQPGAWVDVHHVSPLPCHWRDTTPGVSTETVVLLLDGAEDTRNRTSALFPETLRRELHAVRTTIEAYSQRTPLTKIGGPKAAGITARGQTVRVTLRGGAQEVVTITTYD